MSKQKIREWLENNYTSHGVEWIVDLIDQYTKDQSAWVSVDEYSKNFKDGQLCWVLFPCDSIKLCRLNAYKQCGGAVDFWQDLNGNDLFMNMTKFITVDQPLPPTQEA
jgi:hypothetical protein